MILFVATSNEHYMPWTKHHVRVLNGVPRYASHLTDAEWNLLHRSYAPRRLERPRRTRLRGFDAILYISSTVCQRRLLQHFPPPINGQRYFYECGTTGLLNRCQPSSWSRAAPRWKPLIRPFLCVIDSKA